MKYGVYLSTKITPKKLTKLNKEERGILAVESYDYTKTEIKALKATGYKVLAYLSVGTIEKERSWWKSMKKYALKKLEDWPDEYFADLTQKPWRSHLYSQAKKLKKKGFDGLWLDNIDVYEYYKSEDMKTYISRILSHIKTKVFADKGYIMVNGGSKYLETGAGDKFISGYTQEEVFSRITSYKGTGKFGKQKKEESEYYKKIISQCMAKGINCFLLEYTKDEDLKDKIRAFRKEGKCTGYYISGGVDL